MNNKMKMSVNAAALAVVTLAVGLLASPPLEAKNKHKRQDPLLVLAREVESSARYAHREAERTAHHGTFREARALRRLHELEASARLFSRELRAQGPYSPYVESRFDELRQAHRAAQYSLRFLHPYPAVENEFARMGSLMSKLDYEYGARLAHFHGAPHRHDGRRGSYGYVAFDDEWADGRASLRFDWND